MHRFKMLNRFLYTSEIVFATGDRWIGLDVGRNTAQGWASKCPDVKNYKWRLNPVCHRMLYSCTHMATVGSKGYRW